MRFRRYYIYKYVANQQIIYIGKTYRPLDRRIYEHSKELQFMQYSHAYVLWFEVDSRIEMDVAEKILISKYKPILNTVDNDESILKLSDFTEPVWKPYASWGMCTGYNKDLQKHMLKMQLLDLDQDELKWYNALDCISYLWDLYLDPGWDYLDESSFLFEWDFDFYEIPDCVMIDGEPCRFYDFKSYSDHRHTWKCVLNENTALKLVHEGNEAVNQVLKQYTIHRLELSELLEKFR